MCLHGMPWHLTDSQESLRPHRRTRDDRRPECNVDGDALRCTKQVCCAGASVRGSVRTADPPSECTVVAHKMSAAANAAQVRPCVRISAHSLAWTVRGGHG